MNILIVDDDFLVRELIKEYISKFSRQFFETETFAQAVSLMGSTQDFDIIILDNQLPDGFGINLIELAVSKTTNIIMFTSDAVEYEFRDKAIDSGARLVLSKNAPHFRLIDEVSEVYNALRP